MKKQLFIPLIAAFSINVNAQYPPVLEYGIFFNSIERDRLEVNATTRFDLGNQDFTIYANIRMPLTLVDNPTILSNRGSGNQGIRFGLKDRKLYLKIADNPALINTNGITITDSICHTVAVKRTADMIEFFVDGLSSGAYSYPVKSINSTSPYWIGNDPISPSTCAFHGFMNEVAMWDVSLSNYAIGNVYPESTEGTDEGLIALWEMNEGTGQFAYDAGPNGISAQFGTSRNINITDPVWAIEDCNDIGALRTADNPSPETNEAAPIILRPNPAVQFTSIVMEENISGTLQLFNASGRLVKTIEEYTSGENILLNEELPSGIYQVIFKTEHETYSTKLSILK